MMRSSQPNASEPKNFSELLHELFLDRENPDLIKKQKIEADLKIEADRIYKSARDEKGEFSSQRLQHTFETQIESLVKNNKFESPKDFDKFCDFAAELSDLIKIEDKSTFNYDYDPRQILLSFYLALTNQREPSLKLLAEKTKSKRPNANETVDYSPSIPSAVSSSDEENDDRVQETQSKEEDASSISLSKFDNLLKGKFDNLLKGVDEFEGDLRGLEAEIPELSQHEEDDGSEQPTPDEHPVERISQEEKITVTNAQSLIEALSQDEFDINKVKQAATQMREAWDKEAKNIQVSESPDLLISSDYNEAINLALSKVTSAKQFDNLLLNLKKWNALLEGGTDTYNPKLDPSKSESDAIQVRMHQFASDSSLYGLLKVQVDDQLVTAIIKNLKKECGVCKDHLKNIMEKEFEGLPLYIKNAYKLKDGVGLDVEKFTDDLARNDLKYTHSGNNKHISVKDLPNKLVVAAKSYAAVNNLNKELNNPEVKNPNQVLENFAKKYNEYKDQKDNPLQINPDPKVKQFFVKVGFWVADILSLGLVGLIMPKDSTLLSDSQRFFKKTGRLLQVGQNLEVLPTSGGNGGPNKKM